MSNKLTDLAIETLLIEKDIPFRIDYAKEDPLYRFNIDDFDIYIFSQTWGSTALGFDELGSALYNYPRRRYKRYLLLRCNAKNVDKNWVYLLE